MAQRRMIDKRTIQTQKFLRLPLETQALYFHLMLNADDDGVVEAFPVVRMVGAAEDSLGLLVVKQFIKPLNEEMVYFIIDFKEQNTIKKDRYKASKYAQLLTNEEFGTEMEPKRNQLGTSDKNRLDKNRLDKNNNMSGKPDDVIPYSEILEYLNKKTGRSFRNVEANKKLIKARWNEGYKLEDFKTVVDNMVSNWSGKMFNGVPAENYLQPKTLFSNKFDSYLNQVPRIEQKEINQAYDDLGLPF
ncbi:MULTISPECIES: conserved phage C-terminal domain-containing protein [Lactococcus]|uniref:conserved C-terminal domain-containing protein n=1 Tax=Lactococcus phage r1t TaxID=43685 RepID=UPI000009BBD5|nr:conserved phage C-terminal domain-containing protein [Lactococcus cremoris]NP_695039.1 conserved C-terminal domain-containing protein [Lactococcus phage r1t]AAB18686.1 ORF11 [Lactococcus phage r1t]MBU8904374.1 conserved phage C-terminal domain-containing protein [Lactococcus cremoris]